MPSDNIVVTIWQQILTKVRYFYPQLYHFFLSFAGCVIHAGCRKIAPAHPLHPPVMLLHRKHNKTFSLLQAWLGCTGIFPPNIRLYHWAQSISLSCHSNLGSQQGRKGNLSALLFQPPSTVYLHRSDDNAGIKVETSQGWESECLCNIDGHWSAHIHATSLEVLKDTWSL